MEDTMQGEAQCPFYRRDDGHRRITCEGIMDDTVLVLKFRKREDFAIQAREFCCKRFDHCEIYRMLMEKYD